MIGPEVRRRAWWVTRRSLDAVAGGGAAVAQRALFAALGRAVVGRTVSVRVGGAAVRMLVTDFDSTLHWDSLMAGRFGEVSVGARDVVWESHRFERARATLRGLRLGNEMPPTLRADAVDLTVELPPPVIEDVFSWAAPRLAGVVGSDGVARVHLANRVGSGHLEVDAELRGSVVWLRPQAVVRRHRWVLPKRTPAYPVRLPPLPHGMEIRSVTFAPNVVAISGSLPRWQVRLPRARLEDVLEDVIGHLTGGSPQSLIWPARPTSGLAEPG